jgi:hypothetical protein
MRDCEFFQRDVSLSAFGAKMVRTFGNINNALH